MKVVLIAGRREDAQRELWATLDKTQTGSETEVAAREELRRIEAGG